MQNSIFLHQLRVETITNYVLEGHTVSKIIDYRTSQNICNDLQLVTVITSILSFKKTQFWLKTNFLKNDLLGEYYRVSPVAQLVKNSFAVWETWVRSLGWEDSLEKGKAAHSSILAWRIPWTVIVHGVTKSLTRPSDFHFGEYYQY